MSTSHPSSDSPDVPAIRIANLLATGDVDRPGSSAREGLPPSFRMRADAHYVDQLDAPPADSATKIPVNREGRTRPPTVDPNADVTTELERSLSALGVCANLLADSAPELARLAAANLIRAEVCRARCLLMALRILRDDVTIRRVPVSAHTLVERVLQSVDPERRLRGVAIERQGDVSLCRVSAEEELLVSALSGILLAAFGVLDGVTDARVTVTAHADGGFVFAVGFDGRRLPTVWTDLVAWLRAERPGDGGAVLLQAARSVVERYEGRAAVSASERGSELRVSLPRLPD